MCTPLCAPPARVHTPAHTPRTGAGRPATAAAPIVFAVGEVGIVKSLAQPGGNLTGVDFFNYCIVTKQVALLRDLMPARFLASVYCRPHKQEEGGYSRPLCTLKMRRALAYFLTSPGAGVGFGAPELSFSAGILREPAAPVVCGEGFALVPPVVPLGFRSTAPLLPPACSSICFVVP